MSPAGRVVRAENHPSQIRDGSGSRPYQSVWTGHWRGLLGEVYPVRTMLSYCSRVSMSVAASGIGTAVIWAA